MTRVHGLVKILASLGDFGSPCTGPWKPSVNRAWRPRQGMMGASGTRADLNPDVSVMNL